MIRGDDHLSEWGHDMINLIDNIQYIRRGDEPQINTSVASSIADSVSMM